MRRKIRKQNRISSRRVSSDPPNAMNVVQNPISRRNVLTHGAEMREALMYIGCRSNFEYDLFLTRS